ncbi:MAG: sulfite exporter TauE/SafE family protein [Candidatus Berkiella sp.]
MFIGLGAGLLSGLLGLGGGVVIVPSLLMIFSWQQFPNAQMMQIATSTSLAVIVTTSIMTTWVQSKRKTVKWHVLKWLVPGMMFGALLGIVVGQYLPSHLLKTTFAFFCIIQAIKMILGQTPTKTHELRKVTIIIPFLLSVIIGMSSGLLGIGGGLLVIPLLLWYGLAVPEVSATSAASAFPTALSGAATAMVVGWHIPELPPQCWGFVYWPAALVIGLSSLVAAPLGVWLVHHLPVLIVKRIFGGILLFVAFTVMPSF